MLDQYAHHFIMGGGIGLMCAVFGAFVDYLLMRKRNREQDNYLPSCFLLMTGGLGIAGLVAIGIAFLFRGTIWPAIILGAGVLMGFFFGFAVIFLAALFVSNRRVDFLD